MSVLLLASPVRLGPNVDIACLPENSQIGPDGELKNPGGACVMTSWPKQGNNSFQNYKFLDINTNKFKYSF
jgi:hypothetical protein